MVSTLTTRSPSETTLNVGCIRFIIQDVIGGTQHRKHAVNGKCIQILVRKCEEKGTDLKQYDADLIHQSQNRVKCSFKKENEPSDSIKMGNFLISEKTISFQRRSP
jgi:hypothetical protein